MAKFMLEIVGNQPILPIVSKEIREIRDSFGLECAVDGRKIKSSASFNWTVFGWTISSMRTT